MKIPSRIQVKNEVYEVVYQETIDDPDDIGYCDDDKKTLYIKLGLGKELTLDVLTHELLHSITHQYKIKIKHSELDKLATALVEVCKLNGWIK